MTAAWVMFTSIDPPMLAISIGFERFTHDLVMNQKEFVIAIPSERMIAEVEFFGSQSGRDIDKLKALGSRVEPASSIDGLLLSNASANYECQLTGNLRTGDHSIFAAKIVASHIHEPRLPRLYMLDRKHFGGLSARTK